VANRLRNSFADEAKTAKYFAIIVDSTPDVSHVDQLTIVLKYVAGQGCVSFNVCCNNN